MKRYPLLILGLLTFAATAEAEGGRDGEMEGGQNVGRYQISLSFEGLYFLDTATGELWLKDSRGQWRGIDSPVRQKLETPVAAQKAVTLVLPEDGATMPMVQRERRAIPGSTDTLWVQLGDITGGQVFVEVFDANEHELASRTSLKDKEFVKFKVGQRDVYLQVVEMVNNLLGEDICQIHVSLTEPVIEKGPSEPIEVTIE